MAFYSVIAPVFSSVVKVFGDFYKNGASNWQMGSELMSFLAAKTSFPYLIK